MDFVAIQISLILNQMIAIWPSLDGMDACDLLRA